MGTVRRLAEAAGDITLGQAAEAYLATLRGAEQASTRRTYGRILRWVVAEFGVGTGPGEVDPERFAGWFTARWADRAPSTWNVSLDAVRSAAAYWQRQGWLAADPSRMLERRRPRPDRSRALSRAEVEQLLTREDIGLRERTLWRMLYDGDRPSKPEKGNGRWGCLVRGNGRRGQRSKTRSMMAASPLRLHSAHQRLDAQLEVGLGEHRLDGATGQLGGDGQHLTVDLAQLGDQRLVVATSACWASVRSGLAFHRAA